MLPLTVLLRLGSRVARVVDSALAVCGLTWATQATRAKLASEEALRQQLRQSASRLRVRACAHALARVTGNTARHRGSCHLRALQAELAQLRGDKQRDRPARRHGSCHAHAAGFACVRPPRQRKSSLHAARLLFKLLSTSWRLRGASERLFHRSALVDSLSRCARFAQRACAARPRAAWCGKRRRLRCCRGRGQPAAAAVRVVRAVRRSVRLACRNAAPCYRGAHR